MIIYLVISTGVLGVFLVYDYLKYQKNIQIYFLLGERTSFIIGENCFRMLLLFFVSYTLSGLFDLLLQPFISKTSLIDLAKPLTEGAFHTEFERQRNLLKHDHRYSFSGRAIIFAGLYVLMLMIILGAVVARISYERLNCGKHLDKLSSWYPECVKKLC